MQTHRGLSAVSHWRTGPDQEKPGPPDPHRQAQWDTPRRIDAQNKWVALSGTGGTVRYAYRRPARPDTILLSRPAQFRSVDGRCDCRGGHGDPRAALTVRPGSGSPVRWEGQREENGSLYQPSETRPARLEPASPQNAVLLLVDQQEGLFTKIYEAEQTRRNLLALARSARLLGMPAVLTTALAPADGAGLDLRGPEHHRPHAHQRLAGQPGPRRDHPHRAQESHHRRHRPRRPRPAGRPGQRRRRLRPLRRHRCLRPVQTSTPSRRSAA